jgi:hypothetical protein
MREFTILELSELQTWPRPKEVDLVESIRPRYQEACAALTAVMTGEMGVTAAAGSHRLCPKRVRDMVRRAPLIAPDGAPYGYRVCVPWGTYHRGELGGTGEMPRQSGPHAMSQLLSAQPTITGWVDGFNHPLPPGRPPKSFDRLHGKIVTELKRLNLGEFYPLNQEDQGRRALLRFLRKRRMDMGSFEATEPQEAAPSPLSELFHEALFSRSEFDGHAIDIEAVMSVEMPNGAQVRRPITKMWLLVEIERRSRAILGWELRVGKSYNNLDLCACAATSLAPWSRRELTIPGLEYVPGAGLPSGLLNTASGWRTRSVALDNAMAHASIDLEQAFCRSRGGMLVFGRAHEPRSRPIVEQFFSRLEQGALRNVPGGFEPATRLGKHKIRISNFSPSDCPIQMHLFEELLDVIIANYNATPHPELGNLTPLQFLQMQRQRAFDFVPDSGEQDAIDMGSVVVPLEVHGNRAEGVLPHVNYLYVRYRSPELDGKWEMIGKKILARVYRHDLRSFVLMRSATSPLCVVRAAAPWNRTAHDATTRALIMRWTKSRAGFSIAGVECAIAAYVSHLRSLASTTPKAVDELARLTQVHHGVLPSARGTHVSIPRSPPLGGWFSFDQELDL